MCVGFVIFSVILGKDSVFRVCGFFVDGSVGGVDCRSLVVALDGLFGLAGVAGLAGLDVVLVVDDGLDD